MATCTGELPLELEAVYRAHAPQVARWATRLAGPSEDVEDLVHEVFLVVDRRLSEFRGDARLTTWLYRITQNVVRHQRRRNRWRRWLHGAGDAATIERVSEEAPEDLLERREAVRALYGLLDALPEKYRTVVVLHELEGATGPEIGELLGIEPSTVWVRLHRARAKLATLAEQRRVKR